MTTKRQDLCTVKQAAEQLGVGISTVRRRAAEMELPKVGRDYVLTADDIASMKAALLAPGKRGRKPTVRPSPRARARRGSARKSARRVRQAAAAQPVAPTISGFDPAQMAGFITELTA